MKVLVNGLSARTGGGRTYFKNFLNSEIPQGTEVVALLPYGVDLKLAPAVRVVTAPRVTTNPLFRAVWEKWALPRLLARDHIDLVFCPGGVVSFQAPAGCRVVAMSQNLLPFVPEQRGRFPLGYIRTRLWFLEKVFFKSWMKSDFLILISRGAEKIILARHPALESKKRAVIPHGIGREFRLESNGAFLRNGLVPGGDYILYVSVMDFYKNQIEVVEAFHQVKKGKTRGEILVLAGPAYPPYEKKLRRRIAALGLEGDVILLNGVPQESLPSLYHFAKIVVFASSCENCPFILLEAMGMGKAILSSAVEPMPEIAAGAALFADPLDVNGFSLAMTRLLDDPALREDLSNKAMTTARRFDWSRTAWETWACFEKVLGQSGEPGNFTIRT